MVTKLQSHAVKGSSCTAQEDNLHTWILAQLKVQAGHQMAQPCHGLGTAGSVQGYATTLQGLQMQSWIKLLNSPAASFQLLLDLWRRTGGRALQHTQSEFSTARQSSCYFLPGPHGQRKWPRLPSSARQPPWDGQFHINEILSYSPALWHERAPKWSIELSNSKTSFQTAFQGRAPAYWIGGSIACCHPLTLLLLKEQQHPLVKPGHQPRHQKDAVYIKSIK